MNTAQFGTKWVSLRDLLSPARIQKAIGETPERELSQKQRKRLLRLAEQQDLNQQRPFWEEVDVRPGSARLLRLLSAFHEFWFCCFAACKFQGLYLTMYHTLHYHSMPVFPYRLSIKSPGISFRYFDKLAIDLMSQNAKIGI